MLKKKIFATGLATVMMLIVLVVPTNVFAQERQHVDEENVKSTSINDFRNRKTNVSIYNEWSPFKRVSNNIQTGSEGGSITATESVSFGTSVDGNISGVGILTNVSVDSAVGCTLNAGANERVYMGFRVYYKVETGINEYYDAVTGEVIRSNRYTVKTPQYGEYKLINY